MDDAWGRSRVYLFAVRSLLIDHWKYCFIARFETSSVVLVHLEVMGRKIGYNGVSKETKPTVCYKTVRLHFELAYASDVGFMNHAVGLSIACIFAMEFHFKNKLI